ncbi:MAG: hypothetical protein AAGA85_26800 [Bacteroidota bacterium]
MKRLLSLAILTIFFACEPDNVPEVSGINIASIINEADTEFIYFEDADKQQYYYPTKNDLPGFSNRYLFESEQVNLNMRSNDAFQYDCNIFMSIPDFFNISLPAQVGGSGRFPVGTGELQLIDKLNDVDNQFGPDDDYNFVGSSLFEEMAFTIISLDDQVFQAEFSGRILTKTGRRIEVINGRVRIQLEN